MADEDAAAEIPERLGIIILLLAQEGIAGLKKNEAILTLGRAGLARATIAELCDTTPHSVSVELSAARNSSTRKRARGVGTMGEGDGADEFE